MNDSGGAPQDDPSVSAVRSLARTLLGFAETRARIAASEFEEQVLRFLEVAAWAVAALFFFAIALLLVSVFIILIFWDSNRVLASALLASLFIVAGGFSALMVRACLVARPKFLVATLAELEKDRQKLHRS